jgi:hypothetical protein
MREIEMLRGLDNKDWSKIRHCYGPAVDVPALLQNLQSLNQATRDRAWHELYSNLWHQGTIYEATSYAVPFLCQLLEEPEVPERHRVLVFLAFLFCGRSYWDVHQHNNLSRRTISENELREALSAEMSWVRATKRAVVGETDLYVQLLRAEESGIRIASAYLLGLIGNSDLETIEGVSRAADQ